MNDELLDAELHTRLPKEHKICLQVMADLRHLKLSDIFREVIREKIDRETELGHGLDGEMRDEISDTELFKARTTISLSPDVLAKGQERAREARRSFSNYIEVLIAADPDLKQKAKLPA